MHNCTNIVKLYHRKQYLFTRNIFICSFYAYLQRTTSVPFYNCSLVPLKLPSHQFQTIMPNCKNILKSYNGKESLFTINLSIYRLYAYLQRTTGFPFYNSALVPLKSLTQQDSTIMRNCTKNVKLYHEKQSLFTRNVFNCSLYAYLQRTTSFPFYNCSLVPLKLLSHQFQTIMPNCTNNVKLYHRKHSLFTRNLFNCSLYA